MNDVGAREARFRKVNAWFLAVYGLFSAVLIVVYAVKGTGIIWGFR